MRSLKARQLGNISQVGTTSPRVSRDFFRSPLPELERRRFLAECPRNLAREYNAPTLNAVQMGSTYKRLDSQLADIQFRLSGITRPLDLFLHEVIQHGSVSCQDAVEFVNVIHGLLADTASHITQLPVDIMYKGAGISVTPPRIGITKPAPLLDPKTMLDHVSLTKSVMQLGRKPRQKGKGHSSAPSSRSENEKSDQQTTTHYNKPPQKGKGFHQGPRSTNNDKTSQ